MAIDYRDAAERHWDDAELLWAQNRLANADHLLGLSAECALKAVMQGLGMPLRPDGAPFAQAHRVHINQLWNEFITFATLPSGGIYVTKMGGVDNPFVNWDVSQRYAHHSDLTQGVVAAHKCAAGTTMEILGDAVLDGVVR